MTSAMTCDNRQQGCMAVFSAKSLAAKAAHQKVCGFKTVNCMKCGAPRLLMNKDVHEATECQSNTKIIACAQCGELVPRNDMGQHLGERCPMVDVGCDNAGCSWHGARCQLTALHADDCAHRRAPCPFEHAGCPALLKLSEVAQHERDAVQVHLRLVATAKGANNGNGGNASDIGVKLPPMKIAVKWLGALLLFKLAWWVLLGVVMPVLQLVLFVGVFLVTVGGLKRVAKRVEQMRCGHPAGRFDPIREKWQRIKEILKE